MKLLSASQIKQLDELTIKNEKISSFQLMERAAMACTAYLTSTFDSYHTFLVFCGKGNNGGDGLAITRLLVKAGYSAVVVLIPGKQKGSRDFEKNLALVKKNKKIKIHTPDSVSIEKNRNYIVIDALLGTGFTGEMREELKPVIQQINNSGFPVISVDIPSGLPADVSEKTILKNVVHATCTLTFHVPKKSMLCKPGSIVSGEIVLLDIGLSPTAYDEMDSREFLVLPREMVHILQPRKKETAKWNYGHALLIAGSMEKPGAAMLASRACLRSGAGMCTVLAGEEVVSKIIAHTPEIMGAVYTEENGLPHPDFLSKFSAMGIGPGCGVEDSFKSILKWVMQFATLPIVIDADAINVLAGNKTWIAFSQAPKIFTPHFREFCRLTDCPQDASQPEVDEYLLAFAQKFNSVVVLKSAYTRIATPAGNLYINFTGNAGLAKAGSGDILTGILTALLAQGYSPGEAATLGVCMHGLAADVTLEEQSLESMLPSDVTKNLGRAFNSLLQRENRP